MSRHRRHHHKRRHYYKPRKKFNRGLLGLIFILVAVGLFNFGVSVGGLLAGGFPLMLLSYLIFVMGAIMLGKYLQSIF